MKIQCLDREGSIPNTFLCKINQHTILLNCPIELLTIPLPRDDDDPEHDPQEGSSDLSSILSKFSSQGKRTTDARSNLLSTQIKNCDHLTVFRVPEFNLIDIHSIDLVLISNSELMLGLPYLTEYMGYKGRIIATEPTIEYAKQRMEELVAYHGTKTSIVEPTRATHFSQLEPSLAINGWQSLYTTKDIISCVEKIQPVRYTETLSLFSTLQLVAHSSGHSLGSANWLLETSFKRICFMSYSSNRVDLHPASFDPLVLKNVDVLVVGGLKETVDDFERTRSKIFALIARTVQSLHNVVLVSSASGILFDLIGDLESYFLSIGKEIGRERHQIPIYVVSPIADASLKYANICGEWMNSDRHELLYKPCMPLAHGELMRTNAVIPIDSLEAGIKTQIREPSIVFTGDPTCITKGSLFWFLNHWGHSELNTCIFIDPESPQRIQEDIPVGCKMNFNRLVLDTRLQFDKLSNLLEQYWNPLENKRHLLIPNIKGADVYKQEEQQENLNIHIYERGEIVTIDLKRDWEKASVNEKLASMIEPMIIPNQTTKSSNVSVWAPIHGSLSYYNNLLEIKPSANIKDNPSLVVNHASEATINTELSSIIQKFEQYSIPIHITRDISGVTTIDLPKDMNARIIMNGSSTTIVASDDNVRNLLRKITINIPHIFE